MLKTRNICLLLISLCWIAYFNSLNGCFIADDITGILGNPQLKDPLRFWMEPASLLNSLNLLISGHNPFTYHLTNILLHSLNTILVFFFLGLFFGVESSLLGAVLFALHPIHTEAVTWISGKPYLIFCAFVLGNALLYNRVAEGRKRFGPALYLVSLAIFYYMTLQYYTYYLFPFLLILIDLTLKRWRKSWRLWVPFFLLAALKLASIRVALSGRASLLGSLGAQTMKSHIYAVHSFYSHLWLMLWPQRLTLFHEGEIIPASIFKYGLLYLIPLVLCLIFSFKKTKELFLGIGVFLLFLAPTYSPTPISSLVAERYIYLPSLSLSIAFAYLYQCYSRQYARLKKYLLLALIIIGAIYGMRTIIRNEDYRTPERFWAQTEAVSGNSWQAHSNMGFIYLTKGKFEEAIREYEITVRLNSKSADLYNNLGAAYNKTGNAEQAKYNFEKSLQINPDYSPAHLNLAIIYARQGEYGLARQHSDMATRLGYKNIPQELLELLKTHQKE